MIYIIYYIEKEIMAEDLIQIFRPRPRSYNNYTKSNMPPKKVLKLDTGQRKLTALFKAPVTVPVSADTVKTNQDSDITKPDALTDNGILTHTDTVNKVGNDAIESESAKVTDSRKFQTRWEKLWPWVSYDKSTGKMYCEACI